MAETKPMGRVNDEQLLKDFGSTWESVRTVTKASPINRLEWLAIEIFSQWLVKNYDVTRKKKEVRKS